MYIKKSLALIIIFAFFLYGCNDSVYVSNDKKNTSTSLEDRKEYTLINVNIFLYREDSYKPQPELIIAESEKERLQQYEVLTDINSKIQLPENIEIKSIFVISYYFGKDGVVKQQKDSMYIRSEDEKHYIKPFTFAITYLLDRFKKEDIDNLLDNIGNKDWVEINKNPLL